MALALQKEICRTMSETKELEVDWRLFRQMLLKLSDITGRTSQDVVRSECASICAVLASSESRGGTHEFDARKYVEMLARKEIGKPPAKWIKSGKFLVKITEEGNPIGIARSGAKKFFRPISSVSELKGLEREYLAGLEKWRVRKKKYETALSTKGLTGTPTVAMVKRAFGDAAAAKFGKINELKAYARATWIRVAQSLGLNWQKAATSDRPITGVVSRHFGKALTGASATEYSKGTEYSITLSNANRAVVGGVGSGGRLIQFLNKNAMQSAINGRTKFFYQNLDHDVFSSQAQIAKKYGALIQ